ncbi:MAG: lytic transglycosylase domain-containing protein [Candidatus Eremiobacteraeota bacterium]|nr:lytic transglycosylase domain-containing protein [Candidatus Eremiobacteraeota bacterium]
MITKPFRYVLGLTERLHLPALVVVLSLAACAREGSFGIPLARHGAVPAPDITLLEDRAQSWRVPLRASDLRGLRLLYDTPLRSGPTLAVVRSIVRSNHRLDPFDALVFATYAVSLAREHHMDYGFFCATLLQESAFAPDAVSAAGAVGIAQFTLDTAADEGVDPFDWASAMRGSARLLGRYVADYDGTYADPYATALAAYNAGPGTVAYYHGMPPYAETKDYVADIYDRWSRIVRDATGPERRRA